MEIFLLTLDGAVPVTFPQITALRQEGRLSDDMQCLSLDGGTVWMTYPEMCSRIQAAGSPASASPAAGCPTPSCFQDIPPESLVCPFCGAALANCLPDAIVHRMLVESVRQLDEALASPDFLIENDQIRGGASTQFWVSLVLTLGFAGVAIFLMRWGGDVAPVILPAVIAGVSLLCWLVAWSNDLSGNRIASARTGKKAFNRFFSALGSRPNKAYAALSPAGRRAGPLPEIIFEKIPSRVCQPMEFHDPAGFKDYWKSFFGGNEGRNRSTRLVSAQVFPACPEVCLVTGRVEVSSYYSWILVLFFLGPVGWLVLMVLAAVLNKRVTVPFSKLLLKRGGRWFVLDGLYNGPFDSEQGLALLGRIMGSPSPCNH